MFTLPANTSDAPAPTLPVEAGAATVPTAAIGFNAGHAAPHLSLRQAVYTALFTAAAFHAAYLIPGLHWAIVLFLGGMTHLTRAPTGRAAFYLSFTVGLLCYPIHLAFFYTIFNLFAVTLWMVLPFWLALFGWLGWLTRKHLPGWASGLLLPFLWLGLEYFRCETYPLKFGWLTPALALADHPPAWLLYHLGGFGLSALILLLVAPLTAGTFPRRKSLAYAAAALALLTLLVWLPPPVPLPAAGAIPRSDRSAPRSILAVGVQTETMMDDPSLAALDAARLNHPGADLFVLSEYAFTGNVPQAFRDWCRKHQTYLIAGGSDLISQAPHRKYNTAFVVGPTGETVFKQAKSVPIQFFDDGLAAPSQEVWPSPWGTLGMCVCYDLSYTAVIDAFARKHAQALIVPTMDVGPWGAHEHWLHSRVAPIRAAEYGFPVFRLCSSGISQAIDAHGVTRATAPYPGIGAVLAARLDLPEPKAHRPLDRTLAPVAQWTPVLIMVISLLAWFRRRLPQPTIA